MSEIIDFTATGDGKVTILMIDGVIQIIRADSFEHIFSLKSTNI
jgi:hypothetical protein